MEVSDSDLLTLYVREGDEDAFATVVNRHLSLVYSAALRQVRIPALAEEVSQVVFLELARAAGSLGTHTRVSYWLYQVTHRRAIDLLRQETSRQRRESGAPLLLKNESAPDCSPVEQHLDAALLELEPTDRTAVILRYFEGKSLKEIGQALGTSENAAQKRVSRALEVLRARLAHRGVRIGARGLVLVMSSQAVSSASSKLVASILSAASPIAPSAFTTSTLVPLSVMTLNKSLLTGAFIILTAVAVYQALLSARLRGELQQLRTQVSKTTDSNSLSGSTVSPSVDQQQRDAELLRLRGEVARLGRELAEKESSNAKPPESPQTATSTNDFTAPAATIEAGLQRLLKIAQLNDIEKIRPFIAWKIDEAVPERFVKGTTEAYPQAILDTFGPNGSSAEIQILNHWEEAPGLVRARIEATDKNGRRHPLEMRFAEADGDWKPVITVEQSPAGSTSTTLFLPRTSEPSSP